MSEAEYHRNVKEAAIALINGLISFDEWYEWQKKLIERRENKDEIQ